MEHGGYHAPGDFTENFQDNNVNFNAIKSELYTVIGDFTGRSKTEIAQKIKEYCLENGIKLKTTNQQGSSSNRSTYSTRSSSTSGNVNITINENKGFSFWDYLLLQSLFGSKSQPIIINNAPAATYSVPPQEKNDESKKRKAFILFAALCVITHLAVCAIYHMYFKKEAEKSDKPIDYLVNRQLGIAIFQLAFGLASLIGGGACISQSEIFFPLLINTFICLGSACLFYHERNNTLKTEVEPYMKLAKLLIDDERLENQRTRQHTDFTQNFGHPGATHYPPPPPYPHNPSAPAYDGSYDTYPNLSTQFSNPNVTEFGGLGKS
ncbi:hypothetical protein [Wolbachia endosymbiont of Folsomia candida]|uniref:hypothetical protein n=1 Tax=Wolbachia endosymbiont of Folsomia candida TaxID=169402 RepID=UPI000A46167E|nr:hypothetical protein [Wolbachia endosymbiont of Folsomia candida]APR98830.1 hypothetical protein ASM33_06415 [Wolbachia endosymbiont of Folsomia candida]